MRALFLVALVVAAVGAINWGLVGLLDYNLVTSLFGEGTSLTQIVYIVVGLGGVWALIAGLFGLDKDK